MSLPAGKGRLSRSVGVSHALTMRDEGLCLEEYLDRVERGEAEYIEYVDPEAE